MDHDPALDARSEQSYTDFEEDYHDLEKQERNLERKRARTQVIELTIRDNRLTARRLPLTTAAVNASGSYGLEVPALMFAQWDKRWNGGLTKFLQLENQDLPPHEEWCMDGMAPIYPLEGDMMALCVKLRRCVKMGGRSTTWKRTMIKIFPKKSETFLVRTRSSCPISYLSDQTNQAKPLLPPALCDTDAEYDDEWR